MIPPARPSRRLPSRQGSTVSTSKVKKSVGRHVKSFPNHTTEPSAINPASNDVDEQSTRDSVTSSARSTPSDSGPNIKVVVRCRDRNDREIKAKSHVVVQTSSATPSEVIIEDTTKASQDSRIYKVDHVFGPEADQEMVYDEVVAPIVTEVLAGMNCTIFAYGQTGTGKT